MMTISPNGLAHIAHSEGFREKAYPDHKGQSIGYGHLLLPGEAEKYKDGITEPQARELLKQDAAIAAADVNRLIKVPLNQEQFDALVDFRYNLNPESLEHIAQTLNSGDYKAAAARMKLYNKARINGELVENPGLTARRAEEAKAFEE